MEVVCPSCKSVLVAPEALIGKRVQCKRCGSAFTVEPSPIPMPQPPGQPEARQSQPPSFSPPPQPQGFPAPAPAARAPEMHPPALPSHPAAPPPDAGATAPGKPFLLVFVVFYWVIGGFGCFIIGSLVSSMAGLLGGVLGGALGEVISAPDLHRLGAQEYAFLVHALVDLIGVALWLYGVLLLVASYGLWTLRKWGLKLARVLAIVSLVLNVLVLIGSMILRTGFVSALAGAAISLCIAVYLYQGVNVLAQVRDRLRSSGLGDAAWRD